MSKVTNLNKKIEKNVVGGYKKIEDTVVSSYKKIEDKFVDTFLTEDGESIKDAKIRLKNSEEKRK